MHFTIIRIKMLFYFKKNVLLRESIIQESQHISLQANGDWV